MTADNAKQKGSQVRSILSCVQPTTPKELKMQAHIVGLIWLEEDLNCKKRKAKTLSNYLDALKEFLDFLYTLTDVDFKNFEKQISKWKRTLQRRIKEDEAEQLGKIWKLEY